MKKPDIIQKETLPVLNCGDDDMYNFFFLILSVKVLE